MSWQKLKEKHNEGKEEHFDDPYDYIRHLEHCGDKHGANLVRREMRKREEDAEDKD